MIRTEDSMTDASVAAGAGSARVGWIGAGKMGFPMALNLLAKGVPVTVSDPVAEQVAALVAAGATQAAALSDQAASDIVFATLPHDAALLAVVEGDGKAPGLAEVLRPGAIFVEMSTVSPTCSVMVAERLEKTGISYIRAPLSGSTTMAETASLTVLASGDAAAWARALPHIKLMSARQFLVGAGDEARYMKLVLNTLVGASSAILAEALALGASGGLTRDTMMEVIGASAVASPLFGYKAKAVVEADYTAAFTVTQMIKDFTLILDAARRNGVTLPTTDLILGLYHAASESGLDNEDFFSLVKWQQDLSNR